MDLADLAASSSSSLIASRENHSQLAADPAEQQRGSAPDRSRQRSSRSGEAGSGRGRRPLGHLEIGDDRADLAVRHAIRRRISAHVATGGRLIRIASILPPVLRPNKVPRS